VVHLVQCLGYGSPCSFPVGTPRQIRCETTAAPLLQVTACPGSSDCTQTTSAAHGCCHGGALLHIQTTGPGTSSCPESTAGEHSAPRGCRVLTPCKAASSALTSGTGCSRKRRSRAQSVAIAAPMEWPMMYHGSPGYCNNARPAGSARDGSMRLHNDVAAGLNTSLARACCQARSLGSLCARGPQLRR
jgi:hypothetical protein